MAPAAAQCNQGLSHFLILLHYSLFASFQPYGQQMVVPPGSIFPFLGGRKERSKRFITHFVLAWRIPWTEELHGLQSTGSQRVRHNLGRTHAHRGKAVLSQVHLQTSAYTLFARTVSQGHLQLQKRLGIDRIFIFSVSIAEEGKGKGAGK